MQLQHWIGVVLILAIGYAAGRLFPALGQKVGLP
jgi:hypothetical protein